jgi:predicted phosphohydrolase
MNLGSTIRVFIDTEFTDFVNCDLISIGLAADNGEEFYGQNADYIKSWTSDWVKQNVLPLCQHDKWLKRLDLSARLWQWFDDLPCTHVMITADYNSDWELLVDLLGQSLGDFHPKILGWQNHFNLINMHADAIIKGHGGNDSDYHWVSNRHRSIFQLKVIDFFNDNKQRGAVQHHSLWDAMANRAAYSYLVNYHGFAK